MFLRCFPDRENLKRTRRILALCGDTDAQRNRVGAQRETAYGIHMLAQLRSGFFQQLPTDLSDEAGPAWIQSGDARIDVKVARCAGGEGKFAMTNGLFLKKRAQWLSGRRRSHFTFIPQQLCLGKPITRDLNLLIW